MPDQNDRNRQVIEEFRTNGGKVGGYFADKDLFLVTTTGAKSGQPRIIPLAYIPDGERLITFASKAGAPTHPDWYYNLLAHPEITVEVGNETFQAKATIATGEEYQRLDALARKLVPTHAEYQARTTRQIPLVVIERI
jgi:deazaflavin-dependent oxidoreductase (nitroreductase family)